MGIYCPSQRKTFLKVTSDSEKRQHKTFFQTLDLQSSVKPLPSTSSIPEIQTYLSHQYGLGISKAMNAPYRKLPRLPRGCWPCLSLKPTASCFHAPSSQSPDSASSPPSFAELCSVVISHLAHHTLSSDTLLVWLTIKNTKQALSPLLSMNSHRHFSPRVFPGQMTVPLPHPTLPCAPLLLLEVNDFGDCL